MFARLHHFYQIVIIHTFWSLITTMKLVATVHPKSWSLYHGLHNAWKSESYTCWSILHIKMKNAIVSSLRYSTSGISVITYLIQRAMKNWFINPSNSSFLCSSLPVNDNSRWINMFISSIEMHLIMEYCGPKYVKFTSPKCIYGQQDKD